MTLKEFNNLDISEQAKAVWTGVFIEHRKTSDAAISLYSIENFYVEAWYTPNHDKLLKFHAFEHAAIVNLYNGVMSN